MTNVDNRKSNLILSYFGPCLIFSWCIPPVSKFSDLFGIDGALFLSGLTFAFVPISMYISIKNLLSEKNNRSYIINTLINVISLFFTSYAIKECFTRSVESIGPLVFSIISVVALIVIATFWLITFICSEISKNHKK